MTFLRNTWYVAAWANEVEPGAMLARRYLNEGVVLFRDADGVPVALQDRCPHRFAPLHMGRLKDGVVECGYHGLQFDGRGACVLNPHGDGEIAHHAKVKTYPLEERHEALWIWMGEPELADAALIPDFGMVIDPALRTVRGYLHAPSNYELMTDNLLDLGHTAYLHPATLGSQAIVNSTRTNTREGDSVVYELWAPDGEAPMVTQIMMPRYMGQRVDHWMTSRWYAPGLIHQETGTTLAGAPRAEGDVLQGVHWLTPETESTTHYFNALSRTFRMDEPQIDALIEAGTKQAFTQEDFPMVGAIQDEIGAVDIMSLRPVILSIDRGAIMARNIMRQKLKAEAAAASPSASSDVLAAADA